MLHFLISHLLFIITFCHALFYRFPFSHWSPLYFLSHIYPFFFPFFFLVLLRRRTNVRNVSFLESLYGVQVIFIFKIVSLETPTQSLLVFCTSYYLYKEIWDVQVVLNHLGTFHPVDTLTLKQLTYKLVMLLLLVTGQRSQTIHLF